MAMQLGVTGNEAADISLERQWTSVPLTDDFDPRQANTCTSGTPPPPTNSSRPRSAKKRPLTPYPKLLNLDLGDDVINLNRNMELLYPSMYSAEDDRLHDEGEAFIVHVAPLRPEKVSSVLHGRAASSPRKSKRVARAAGECSGGKRPRPRHTSCTNLGIKRQILRLCGASKSIFSSKYMGVPG